MFNKYVKFNNKFEVNGEDLNTILKKVVRASLKGCKKKITQVVASYIDEYSDEYEAFFIDRINLAVL